MKQLYSGRRGLTPPRRTVGPERGTDGVNRSPDARERHQLYQSREWRALRARYLAEHPWCAECETQGKRSLANTLDHVNGHGRGADWRRTFWVGPFQPLCPQCAARKSNREGAAVPRRSWFNRGGVSEN